MLSNLVLLSVLTVVAHCAVVRNNDALFVDRVINGQLAQPNQFPWHAIVEGTQLNGNRTLCGGALISIRYVLTAAHCIFGNEFEFFNVGLGANNLSRPFITMEITPTPANNRITHPQYTVNPRHNDIGLLLLPIDLPALPSIVPIRLVAQIQITNAFTDAIAVFTGFGRVSNTGNDSQGLRFTETRVLPLADCMRAFGAGVINGNTMCTFGREFDVQGACANDNGGPLVLLDDNNVATLIGVQSFLVEGGCMAAQPTGYMRIGPYLNWISQNAAIPIRA